MWGCGENESEAIIDENRKAQVRVRTHRHAAFLAVVCVTESDQDALQACITHFLNATGPIHTHKHIIVQQSRTGRVPS